MKLERNTGKKISYASNISNYNNNNNNNNNKIEIQIYKRVYAGY